MQVVSSSRGSSDALFIFSVLQRGLGEVLPSQALRAVSYLDPGVQARSPAPAPGRLPFVAWVRAMKAAANGWGPRAEIAGGALT